MSLLLRQGIQSKNDGTSMFLIPLKHFHRDVRVDVDCRIDACLDKGLKRERRVSVAEEKSILHTEF